MDAAARGGAEGIHGGRQDPTRTRRKPQRPRYETYYTLGMVYVGCATFDPYIYFDIQGDHAGLRPGLG